MLDVDRIIEAYNTASEYDYRDNRNIGYAMDELFSQYDPEGEMRIPEIIEIMSPEDLESLFDLASQVKVRLAPGEPGYAKALYEDCKDGYEEGPFSDGVILFYNALKEEGYIDFD